MFNFCKVIFFGKYSKNKLKLGYFTNENNRFFGFKKTGFRSLKIDQNNRFYSTG